MFSKKEMILFDKYLIMRSIPFLILVLLLSPLISLAQQTGNIHLTIQHIENEKGTLRVALFTENDKFLDEPSWSKDIASGGREIIEIDFENIPFGTYAISIFHDLDDNGELDANFIGIPKEPVGFSNDYQPKMGPPKFKGAKFDLAQKKLLLSVNMYTY
jgi:uncharacterized protein (DUF2141 family)